LIQITIISINILCKTIIKDSKQAFFAISNSNVPLPRIKLANEMHKFDFFFISFSVGRNLAIENV